VKLFYLLCFFESPPSEYNLVVQKSSATTCPSTRFCCSGQPCATTWALQRIAFVEVRCSLKHCLLLIYGLVMHGNILQRRPPSCTKWVSSNCKPYYSSCFTYYISEFPFVQDLNSWMEHAMLDKAHNSKITSPMLNIGNAPHSCLILHLRDSRWCRIHLFRSRRKINQVGDTTEHRHRSPR